MPTKLRDSSKGSGLLTAFQLSRWKLMGLGVILTGLSLVGLGLYFGLYSKVQLEVFAVAFFFFLAGIFLMRFISGTRKSLFRIEQQLNALNKSAIVAITDAKGKIIFVNDQFVEISGYSREELLGKDHRLINSKFHSKEFFQGLWKTINEGRVWKGEIRNQRKDGSHYWVDSTIVPILGKGNKVKKFISIRHDITARKAVEASLLEARNQALEASRVKAQFLANMSHEIRTPLNAILGFTTLLADEPLSPKGVEYLQLMHSSGESLLVLINDILDFSKMEAGKMQVETAVFSLQDLVHETVALYNSKALAKRVSIQVIVDPLVPDYICSDRVRLQQVLSNLLSNAIKFTEKGMVSVSVQGELATDGRFFAKISVRDSGIGISDEAKNRLFQSFSQIDGSMTRRYGGTGLGLAICKGICEALGGDISVKSKQGEGSEFTFTFWADPGKRETAITLLPAPSLPPLPQLKILVVDDNATNRLVALQFLRKFGQEADTANDGHEAVLALQNSRYDIVFMDGQMPGMDGIEATKIIRQLGMLDLIIVAFSASASSEDQQNFRDSGMNDFIAKPLTLKALESLFSRLPIAAKRSQSPSIAQQEGFEKRLLERFAGDPYLRDQVIESWIQTYQQALGQIRQAIESFDHKAVVAQAHRFRGSSGYFLADDLIADLRQLEKLAKMQSLAEASRLFMQIEKRAKDLHQQLLKINKNRAVA